VKCCNVWLSHPQTSFLSKHTDICLHSQASKPQLRRWIDTVGEVYAKFVIAATFAALIVLPMCGVPMLRYLRPC
jgi:cation transport ATPase